MQINLPGGGIIKMEIKEMQRQAYAIIEDWNKKNKGKHYPETVFPHIVEELGELAREFNKSLCNWRGEFDKEKFSKELVDVIGQLLILANDFDVDVEETFKKKIAELRERFKLDEDENGNCKF